MVKKGLPTILCRRDGSWKRKLEELIEKNPKEHVTLLAIGEVKTEVLQYLNRRNDLHIIKLETLHETKKKRLRPQSPSHQRT